MFTKTFCEKIGTLELTFSNEIHKSSDRSDGKKNLVYASIFDTRKTYNRLFDRSYNIET